MLKESSSWGVAAIVSIFLVIIAGFLYNSKFLKDWNISFALVILIFFFALGLIQIDWN